jgi:hypothetical protein
MEDQTTLDDLKARINALMTEIEYVHLRKVWPERLVASGIDQRDANKLAIVIGQMVGEYEVSLRLLADLLYAPKPNFTIPENINNWAKLIRKITLPMLEDEAGYLQERLAKYIPPEPEDKDQKESS